ncbi:hypothetical protein AB0L42_36610 [Streptomyces sp. NPDC052287]|uniref:hypothetical protein n=1 Tax=Streptomyces sp. NPDC052287 TaxID=3154950 RepID=UPI0034491B2A
MATKKTSEKNRRDPRAGTTRDLLLFSGNQCAYPKCAQRLMTEDGAWVGELAHIRGAEPESARYDEAFARDKDALRADDNLILLCRNHHREVDDQRTRDLYSVTDLQQIKRAHEDRFRLAVDAAERDIYDVTHDGAVTHCTSLQQLDPEWSVEDREFFVPQINKFADRLREVTPGARGLLAVIVARRPTDINVAEAARRIARSEREVIELTLELEAARLASIDTDWFEGDLPERIVLSSPLEDWPEFWDAVQKHMADQPDASVDDVIVGLDFSLLD